ncbi:T9SS type A sorting domain-containing protein [Chitinophaga sedimenti]|uniref:T9SS type A sorting domain-containing protein n=1 Tax=Chitinophaga sedimenti TaxID=2033606 RepID=UPI002005B945|nr:T9SS type A sorting domain-containing protein [Chitinophaga sedimenti]MCK7556270.1 T9SS type A sorting domain-containing protein [Chitinophaga sedimenti]
MKQNFRPLLTLIVSLTFSMSLSAQTTVTVIDYQNWSSTACNAFAPAEVNVSNIPHRAVTGQPQRDNTNQALSLGCFNSSPANGTEYRLSYNFKAGFKYIIKVNASSYNAPNLFFDFLSSANALSNSCSGYSSMLSATPTRKGVQLSTGTYTDKEVTWESCPGNYPYLLVTCSPIMSTAVQTALIRKITITEITPADPELTLTPTSFTPVCGAPVTQTFTVNNPFNVTGITQYVWNLGASAGAWTYNGNPAATSMTTTANAITLTTAPCTGTPPANFTVTAYKGTTAYKTYTVYANPVPPVTTMAILGDDRICSGSKNYTVSGMPCGSQVTWSSTLANLSCTTCNATTVGMITEGSITLTAAVLTPCSSTPVVLTKTITTGVPHPLDNISIVSGNGNYSAPFMEMLTNYMTVQVNTNGFSNLVWTIAPNSLPDFTATPSSNGQTLDVYASLVPYSNEQGTVRLAATHNVCGRSTKRLTFYEGAGVGGFTIGVSPVPANNILQISVTDNNKSVQRSSNGKTQPGKLTIQHVQVLDKLGNVRLDRKLRAGSRNTSLDVSALPGDVYVLRVFDGSIWQSKQIIVRH